MSRLRNLPTGEARGLSALIPVRDKQVVSMALTKGEGVQITLLAFGEGENISEEQYFGDTLYYMVQGSGAVCLREGEIPVKEGEVLMVPAGRLHGIRGDGAYKILQITLEPDTGSGAE